jgi:hypothetical protein
MNCFYHEVSSLYNILNCPLTSCHFDPSKSLTAVLTYLSSGLYGAVLHLYFQIYETVKLDANKIPVFRDVAPCSLDSAVLTAFIIRATLFPILLSTMQRPRHDLPLLTVPMAAVSTSETSVNFYETARRNILIFAAV